MMATLPRPSREKISTTISSASLSYFDGLIRSGEARTLAEAIDAAVQRLSLYENRERLANDTAAYFEQLSPAAAKEEAQLAKALGKSARGIDFDREP